MTQEHSRRGGLEPDTSERLYTADDLAPYTASRLRAEAPLPTPPHGDPLTDPCPERLSPLPRSSRPWPIRQHRKHRPHRKHRRRRPHRPAPATPAAAEDEPRIPAYAAS